MRGKSFVTAVAAAAIALAVGQARAGDRAGTGLESGADEPQREAPATAGHGATWYGWQTFLSDAASGGLVVGGLAMKNGGIAFIGGIGYVAGAPAIHSLHGSDTRMGVSVALRLLLPVLGYAIANGQSTCKDPAEDACGLPGVLGGIGGALVALPIDWFGLSWESAKIPSGARVAPSVSWQKHGGTVGLTGTF